MTLFATLSNPIHSIKHFYTQYFPNEIHYNGYTLIYSLQGKATHAQNSLSLKALVLIVNTFTLPDIYKRSKIMCNIDSSWGF